MQYAQYLMLKYAKQQTYVSIGNIPNLTFELNLHYFNCNQLQIFISEGLSFEGLPASLAKYFPQLVVRVPMSEINIDRILIKKDCDERIKSELISEFSSLVHEIK
jgi:hypothetical protein